MEGDNAFGLKKHLTISDEKYWNNGHLRVLQTPFVIMLWQNPFAFTCYWRFVILHYMKMNHPLRELVNWCSQGGGQTFSDMVCIR